MYRSTCREWHLCCITITSSVNHSMKSLWSTSQWAQHLTMSEYEAVIDEIGSFGPSQREVFILVSLFEAPVAWGLLVHPVFASRMMPWYCDSSNGTSDTSSLSGQTNMTDWLLSNCTMYEASQCENVVYFGDYSSVVSEVSGD